MKKVLLKRDGPERPIPKGPAIVSKFEEAKQKGDQIINNPLSDVKQSETTQTVTNSPYGVESLFQSGTASIVYKSVGSTSKNMPETYQITINECFDELYRTGKITFYDLQGMVEFSGLYTTYEKEKISLTLRNKFEGDLGRTFDFHLYNMREETLDAESTFKRHRIIEYDLQEAPFFKNYYNAVYGDSYKENTAIQIVSELMANKIKSENIKIVNGDNDPLIPSFIIPNWNVRKTIEYLSNYCDKGPLKVFNVSQGDKTVTIIAPLSKIVQNRIYPSTYKIAPSVSEACQYIRLNNFVIYGPRDCDEVNTMSGQTIMSFDYFKGTEDTLQFKHYSSLPNYSYDAGEPRYWLRNRTYGSIISGEYYKGAQLLDSKGHVLLQKKETKNNSKQWYDIDVEPKKMVQAKILNRFNAAYFDQMMLYSVMPGNRNINVGQTFDITIPSVNQSANIADGGVADESLSGKWILWKIRHEITIPPNSKRPKYEMHCYFLRPSLTKTNKQIYDKL
jgi:hypothetical protein